VGYRADLQNLRTKHNLNCHTSVREELTKQLPLKEEKMARLPKHLVKLRQSLYLNTKTKAGY
jgi:hypothetical protein